MFRRDESEKDQGQRKGRLRRQKEHLRPSNPRTCTGDSPMKGCGAVKLGVHRFHARGRKAAKQSGRAGSSTSGGLKREPGRFPGSLATATVLPPSSQRGWKSLRDGGNCHWMHYLTVGRPVRPVGKKAWADATKSGRL